MDVLVDDGLDPMLPSSRMGQNKQKVVVDIFSLGPYFQRYGSKHSGHTAPSTYVFCENMEKIVNFVRHCAHAMIGFFLRVRLRKQV